MERSSGILLHPTSLPGTTGIGDIAAGYRFVDWLVATKQSAWQILPLNPPGAGISPYTCVSSHAGNPALISLAMLADQTDLLTDQDLKTLELEAAPEGASPDESEIHRASVQKYRLLSLAAERFHRLPPSACEAYEQWCRQNQNWLIADAQFHAISALKGTADWTTWPKALIKRDAAALERLNAQLEPVMRRWQFIQWVFDQQWMALKTYANQRGVAIIGDLPIYCAHHSVDVWSEQSLFELTDSGQATIVAGVPPDYFSATGQRWGSPLYRWPQHEQSGFAWWRNRMTSALKWCDHLRIDHFRAFASYWAIPHQAPDARTGRWLKGPGRALFDAIRESFDPLPIIVEDLGLLTDDVIELREQLGLPGMSILQFAFGSDTDNVYLPHQLTRNTVVYTGTHDNDTSQGWWSGASAEEKTYFLEYFGTRSRRVHRVMVRAALGSVARLAIIPMQDVIGAGSEARMNMPGEVDGQWTWRLRWSDVSKADSRFLATLTHLYGRTPTKKRVSSLSG